MTYFKTSFRDYTCHGGSISCEVGPMTIHAAIEHDTSSSPDDDEGMSEEAKEAWKRGEWSYVGVVISVSCDGITLVRNADSLWGLACNCPEGDTSYLTEVAEEMVKGAARQGVVALHRLAALAAEAALTV